jgi:large subunit ribosomal protein L1
MGTQKPVVIGENTEEIVGGPIAEHHGKKKSKIKDQKSKVEEKIKEKKFAFRHVKPEEKVKEVGETAQKAEKIEVEEKPKKVKVGKAKIRSKKYQEIIKLIERTKKYDVAEAIGLVKKTSSTKFDGNVEVHLRLLAKTGKPENLRGLIKYPHPTGKSVKVVVIDEKIAKDIEKTGKAEADIYLATPAMMSKIAKLAKILGPKGKMPNPKSGTITENPVKTQKELETGQVEYKTDSFGNIHQVIGKVSATPKILEENFQVLLAALPQDKIVSVTLHATMGPGIKVQV